MSSVVGQIASGGAGGPDSVALSCGRNNTNVNNLWLRDAQGIPLNLSPWIIPFNAEIIAISASTRVPVTCDFDIYRQPDVRAGGIPDPSNRIARLTMSGVEENLDDSLTVSLNAGDGLGVFARGTSIAYPRVILWIVRTS
jgi:hypothetical protein